jgi:NAD(P)-dependent dehydrogenase (short-subunit alcohol dehydrogenase family)
VANAVLFLASDEAGFVNGTTLMVEGGATIYMPSASAQFAGGGKGAA